MKRTQALLIGLGLILMAILGAATASYFSWRHAMESSSQPAPIELPSAANVLLLGSIGGILAAALLAVVTWMLVSATERLSVATDVLARVSQMQYDAAAPVAQIVKSNFTHVVDEGYLGQDEDGNPGKPPKPELEIVVRNVGGRPLEITHLLVEETLVSTSHGEDGVPTSFDTYAHVTAVALDKAEHASGVALPIPPNAESGWSAPNHGVDYDGSCQGVRLGVRLAGGRDVWGPNQRA